MTKSNEQYGSLDYDGLRKAAGGSAAAIRIVTRLEPVGHPQDKVFPPTYSGGEYAFEKRYPAVSSKSDSSTEEEPVDAVLLHSVAGQANLMEEALKYALGETPEGASRSLEIPLLKVDFKETAAAEYVTEPVTVLDAPHRVFDAIFRDSVVPDSNGGSETVFKDTPVGQDLARASLANATPLYKWSPTSIVFGCWNSANDKVPGKINGSFKLARALVSEIVGFETITGVKVGGKLDPLGITNQPLYETEDGDWTANEELANRENDAPVKFKLKRTSKGKPSELLHGNIAPSIGGTGDEGSSYGGVTMKYALQTTVLSLAALRRLRFPLNEESERKAISQKERDIAARTVLAALGLVAITTQREHDYFLRSRCELRAIESPPFEFVVQGRETRDEDKFQLDFSQAVKLLHEALDKAEEKGLKWKTGEDMPNLKPKSNLAELIRLSHERGGAEDDDAEAS